MLVERLELENFLSYRKLELEFPYGSIAFIGENGSGKSTLLDAIYFALFKDNARGRGLQNLIRRGERRASVKLYFRIGNSRFLVIRTLELRGGRLTTSSQLYKLSEGGVRLLATRLEVDREIERLLGVDKAMFLTAVYVKQGEITRLVEMRPSERKEAISRLLGIYELERAYEGMRSVIAHFKEKAAELRGRVKELSRLEKDLKAVREDLAKVCEGVLRTEFEFRRAKSRLEEVEAELKRLKELDSIHRKAEELKATIKELVENSALPILSELERARKAKEELSAVKKELAKLKVVEDVEKLALELRDAKVHIDQLDKRVREYRELKSRLAELAPIAEEYCAIESVLKGKDAVVEKLVQASNEVRRLEDNARRIEDEVRDLEERLRTWAKLVSEVLGVNVEIEELPAVVERALSELRRKLEGLRSRREQLLAEVSRLKTIVLEESSLVEMLHKEGSACPLCSAPLSVDRRRELIEAHRAKIVEAKRALKRAERELRKVTEDLKEVEEGLTLLQRLNPSDIRRLLEELKAKRARMRRIEGEIERARSELRGLELELKKLKELEERANSLKALYEEYRGVKRVLEERDPSALERELSAARRRAEALERRINEAVSRLGYDLETAISRLKELRERKAKLEGVVENLAALEAKFAAVSERLYLLAEELERLEGALRRAGFDKEKLERLEEEAKELGRKVGSLESELKNLLERSKELRNTRRELEKRIHQLREDKRELEALEAYIGILERIRRAFSKDGVQRKLRAAAKPVVERYLNYFASLFNLDITEVKLTDDFDVEIVDRDGVRDFSMASGGEKVAIALALRLAIAKALAGAKIGLIMLDEPTAHLDEERRRSLVAAIRRLFSGKGEFPQLILVTHDRELEEAASHVYLVEKVGGESLVKPLAL